jgi:2'-5' RNA ligase
VRLFVAVDVSDDVRSYAEAARRAICRHTPRLGRELRWVDTRHMHVTLRFIGEVGEAEAEPLRQAFGQPLPHAPFEVEPAEPHWLPSPARPRVLVLGFRRGAAELRALRDTVDQRVRAHLAIEPEERPFLPHLTLARARDPRRLPRLDLGDARTPEDQPRPSACIDGVTLYESHLSPKGPSYVALARAPLAGTA